MHRIRSAWSCGIVDFTTPAISIIWQYFGTFSCLSFPFLSGVSWLILKRPHNYRSRFWEYCFFRRLVIRTPFFSFATFSLTFRNNALMISRWIYLVFILDSHFVHCFHYSVSLRTHTLNWGGIIFCHMILFSLSSLIKDNLMPRTRTLIFRSILHLSLS